MTITWWLIIFTTTLWLAWDIYADWKWGAAATESVLIDTWLRKYKVLIFMLGFLCGHLFWQVHICN